MKLAWSTSHYFQSTTLTEYYSINCTISYANHLTTPTNTMLKKTVEKLDTQR